MTDRATGSVNSPIRTERGLERLIFFSDAVVAIAITLIVLPLVDNARDVADSSTSKFLSENSYGLIAAGVSFVVISSFWREHHRLFERATGYTPLLVRINMLWLLCIVALPLATVLDVYSHRADRLAIGIYLGVMIGAMTLSRLAELVLYRANLLADAERVTGIDIAVRWISVAVVCVALVIALLVPHVGLWSLLLWIAVGPVEGVVNRRWKAHQIS
ncbi:TMEM175 family protein [Nocardia sp. NPDC050175]|uniref:TMEM175 family protein n=1 Tax=Nocardia sp. NPDC050175 TaxID=3364317 RepID=UPI003799A966